MIPIKNGIVTTPFDQMRPLSVPVEKRTHIHGAIDIASRYSWQSGHREEILCPVDGYVWGYVAIRVPEDSKSGNRYWPKMPVIHGRIFPWANYFYDMYGGVIIIEETNFADQVINTHLICHSYANQIFNLPPLGPIGIPHSVEESKKSRYPIIAWYTDKFKFKKGDVIGSMGNAGYSTGSHIHWEIHQGMFYQNHADRINPMTYL